MGFFILEEGKGRRGNREVEGVNLCSQFVIMSSVCMHGPGGNCNVMTKIIFIRCHEQFYVATGFSHSNLVIWHCCCHGHYCDCRLVFIVFLCSSIQMQVQLQGILQLSQRHSET